MLFNSYEFLLIFLPIVLVGYGLLGACAGGRSPLIWLMLSSFFFYGFWNPPFLALLLSSIVVNFYFGKQIMRREEKKTFMVIGICFNVLLLAYFKYANFFVDQLNLLLSEPLNWSSVILPLAISFFTFQQIAYLSDVAKGEAEDYSLIEYALFVSFFPQLIAGPIVHHEEMMPQFKASDHKLKWKNIAPGLSLFIIGLFKKVYIADKVAVYSSKVFGAADRGIEVTMWEAWTATFSYTGQLYFDFSGYTDMAIGLGMLFGIHLPLNFNSPYKAASAIDFWRRWHMTLSRFLRDYLYIPLGGNRTNKRRQLVNLTIVMFLGGLWHGAGWTFVIWGLMHGLYLVINHSWRGLGIRLPVLLGWVITLFGVVLSWVMFRAADFDAAAIIYKAMFGATELGEANDSVLRFLIPVLCIAFFTPNSQQIMGLMDTGMPAKKWQWQPTFVWALIIATLAVFSALQLSEVSEFLYFRF